MKRLFISLIFIFAFSQTASALDWTIEKVDTNGDTGKYVALKTDSYNNPCIAYFDKTGSVLKYAQYSSSSWNIETIGPATHSYPSLYIDQYNNPFISFNNIVVGEDSHLDYATKVNNTWEIERVNDVGWHSSSILLDNGGLPRIAYYGSTVAGSTLYYAKYDGSQWNNEIVDIAANSGLGLIPSQQIDSSGNTYVSYRGDYDFNTGKTSLKCAVNKTGVWEIQTVVNNGGGWTSLTLDNNGNPVIVYDSEFSKLAYAKWDGEKWNSQIIDNSPIGSGGISSAQDAEGQLHVAYGDAITGDLKYASWNGDSWVTEKIDGNGNSGRNMSLFIDSLNRPHIAYYDVTNGDLKYATVTPEPASMILFGIGGLAMAYKRRKVAKGGVR